MSKIRAISQYDNEVLPQVSCNTTSLSILIGEIMRLPYDSKRLSYETPFLPCFINDNQEIIAPSLEDAITLFMDSKDFLLLPDVKKFFKFNRVWAESIRPQTIHALLCAVGNHILTLFGKERGKTFGRFTFKTDYPESFLAYDFGMLSVRSQYIKNHLIAFLRNDDDGYLHYSDPGGCFLDGEALTRANRRSHTSGYLDEIIPFALQRTQSDKVQGLYYA